MTQSIHDIAVTTASGETTTLGAYKGKALLIINVASKCGYTNQYAGLQALHEKYKDQGLAVLAFPCNDFGGQEPGTIEEVQQFCSTTYGVTFDLFDKVGILENTHPLYQYLTAHAEPSGQVQWNFEKFLIGKDGAILGRFGSRVKPDDAELTDAIEAALA